MSTIQIDLTKKFTDLLINNLIEANVEPYYRLGITIENQAYIKPYHTFPPKDYEKWAQISQTRVGT